MSVSRHVGMNRVRTLLPPLLAALVTALPLGGCGLLTGDAFDVTLAPGGDDAGPPLDGAGAGADANADGDASPSPFRGMVAAGTSHTCAVLAGSARCWGLAADGELGNGSTVDRSAAVAVSDLGTGVVHIAAGAQHSCAVIEDGSVQCWGKNDSGQVGQPLAAQILAPRRVPLDAPAVAVALADESTCALMKDGSVRCWGGNASGQLGNGMQSTAGDPTPVRVTGLGAGVTAIAAGASHVCAVVGGAVRCWGWNHFSQLGDGSIDDRSTPVTVPGLSNVVAVTAGAHHTCALTSAGAVSCWGANDSGQVGDGTTTTRTTAVPVSGLSAGATAIAAGQLHTCALEADGVHCWGHNVRGELGNNSFDDSLVPFAVPVGLIGSSVVSLSAGGEHTCVLTSAAHVQCWGSNTNGELGNGSNNDSNVAVQVVGL
ncbi:MAG: regulator of chromosome condensation [Myxococcaceae bacterium]|nr:regulator of chromosome condensation [Myxococcaceae bacterium]